jgi:anti-anti-sigma factor
MKIHEQLQGAVIILKPEGPLVELDAGVVKQRLLQTLNATLGRFVVDMSSIPYVDSKGLEVLVDVTEEMGRSGQALRMCGANKTVREVLELTDLASLFEHFHDANTAVRSFL